MALTVGSLFAGIGGFDLGFERAGFEIKWQVEIQPYAQRVLSKHWPDVQRFGDVRECGSHNLSAVDVLCGGFPCQDISDAGHRAGIDGDRSGLWREYARLISELRPRYVVVENVSALLDRGMGRVLGDLAALGYDAEWSIVSACAVGAPHMRERVFVVAYPAGERWLERCRLQRDEDRKEERHIHQWARESMPSRVADGIPNRMDRVHACGNAIVPQESEWIARRILEAEAVAATD